MFNDNKERIKRIEKVLGLERKYIGGMLALSSDNFKVIENLQRTVKELSDKLEAIETRDERQKLADEYHAVTGLRANLSLADATIGVLTVPFGGSFTFSNSYQNLSIPEFKKLLNEAVAEFHRKNCKPAKARGRKNVAP